MPLTPYISIADIIIYQDNFIYLFKAVGRSIADYAAPVWSTNASMEKIQVAQNEALRISTGAHKMSSIDHLHCEAQMLKVTEHSDLLSAQYLVKCLDHENVCHNITTLDQPPRMMKHTYKYVEVLIARDCILSFCTSRCVYFRLSLLVDECILMNETKHNHVCIIGFIYQYIM